MKNENEKPATRSALLERVSSDGLGIIGVLSCDGIQPFVTLEPAWRNNDRQVSCIPVGSYLVVGHESPRHRACWRIEDVPNRSEILIHVGNYPSETQGCILIGEDRGESCVRQSRIAMRRMMQQLDWPKPFVLTITGIGEPRERYEAQKRSDAARIGDAEKDEAATEGLTKAKTTKAAS